VTETEAQRAACAQKCMFGDAQNYCGAPATMHVLDAEGPTMDCDEHRPWWDTHPFIDMHPIGPECGVPGAMWMSERCVTDHKLPSHDYTWYGCQVAHYDEHEGFIVTGHGRRSYAALNGMVRDQDGRRCANPKKIKKGWALFDKECGCTEEQHALHGQPLPDGIEEYSEEAEAYDDCDSHCGENCGLPPCGDEYGWMMHWARVGDDGQPPASAVPILEYRWY
jgi:hypothetical protein